MLPTPTIQIYIFQSTLRRTERLGVPLCGREKQHFNPRSDERSDDILACIKSMCVYFNPRSDERSDKVTVTLATGVYNFNPRSDERSDLSGELLLNIHCDFNPRSDERSDVFMSKIVDFDDDFNPRSDERSDCNFAQKNEKTIQNRLIILLFSTNSLRLLCSCIQYSFFLFIFHGANDLVILCSLSFRTTSKN